MHELALYFSLLSSFNNANHVAIDLAHNVFVVGAVLSRKPENVLELGIGSGYVTNSLLHAIHFNRKGQLTSVDNWCDWNGAQPPFASPLRAAGVNIVVSGEEEFVRSAADDAYDFLVSDADHFRSSAWLDQRVKESELDIAFDDDNGSFVYIQPDRGGEPIELAPEPSWGRVAYVRR